MRGKASRHAAADPQMRVQQGPIKSLGGPEACGEAPARQFRCRP